MYVKVEKGQVTDKGLPKTGKLSNGKWVSGYDKLPLDVLKSEGWLPYTEDKPEYNSEMCVLVFDYDEITEDSVIRHYTASFKPQETLTLEERVAALEVQVEQLKKGASEKT